MNVFLKNTTSSPITVAGYTVHYIDSADAELVEVEGTSGQALPSVGDTVTFGNYPQATSTPDPIEWTVLAVDSVNGKALLLSKYILDAHVYNTEKVSVSWATCALRDWLNNTFYNAAFNSEEQSGIVTTHNAGGGLSSDDKVFCLTQDESASYIPVEADRRAVATQKAIDDGTYAPTDNYGNWWNLDWDVDSYYRVDMISSGGAVSSALVTVAWVGVRPAIWVSFASVKYNAFKFTLNGTPYYYVIDGTHDTWTDDLSAWGYSEVQPALVLPTVTTGLAYTSDNQSRIQIYTNAQFAVYDSAGNALSGDANSSYALISYFPSGSGSETAFISGFSLIVVSGSLLLRNDSGETLWMQRFNYATCSDSTATVVTVYNSSNTAYNAFKYTANNTDYYYVLDGTQTDWVSDLASIGYSLTQTLEIILALRYDPSTSQWKTVAFDQTPAATENYWWGCVIDQAGVTALQAIGLTYHDPSSIWGGSKFTGPIGNVVYNSGYSYEVLALYSDMGTTEVAQSLLPSLTLEPLTKDNTDLLVIWSKNVLDTTPVKTWKVRITKL